MIAGNLAHGAIYGGVLGTYLGGSGLFGALLGLGFVTLVFVVAFAIRKRRERIQVPVATGWFRGSSDS